jgi:hypothetical protein
VFYGKEEEEDGRMAEDASESPSEDFLLSRTIYMLFRDANLT